MIIFVGDKPSGKNISNDIPFVGTVSYKRLLDWIYKLNIDITNVMICNKEHVRRYGKDEQFVAFETYCLFTDLQPDDKVIALGVEASKALEALKVEHFKLPHPSGRNYQLNNKQYEDKVLKGCRKYLKGEE